MVDRCLIQREEQCLHPRYDIGNLVLRIILQMLISKQKLIQQNRCILGEISKDNNQNRFFKKDYTDYMNYI